MGFTKEELEEMRRADEEIERSFALTPEDLRRGRELDKAARLEAMPHDKRNRAAQQRAYYEANREKVAAQQRAYYEANREKVAEYKRAYREANREKVAEYKRAYREANREKVAAQQRAYYEARRRAKRESVEAASLGA